MNMPIDHAALQDAMSLPPTRPNRPGHVFDLHPALHIATFAGFFIYLGIMWLAFATDELMIPFVIFAVFLTGGFVVPAWWARVAPPSAPTGDWADFMREGVVCQTGRLDARSVMLQVLIMPAMLIGWGLIVAVIRASV